MKMLRFVSIPLLSVGLMLVHRTTSAQVVTTFAGSGAPGSVDGNGAEASFYYPQGLAVGPTGNVYVADTLSSKIRKITPQGLVTTLAGDGHPGYDQFFAPMGVAADAFGNVWVADADDGIDGQWVKEVGPGGGIVNLTLYPGFNPIALAMNSSGRLYVLDLDGGVWTISIIDPARSLSSSTLLTRVVPPPPYAPPSPHAGVAVDEAGNVYFSSHDRIQKISPDGTVITLAGSGSAGSADGAGTSASFRDPNGLAVDSSGNIYVADSGNNSIRKITSSGIVTTLAGSAGRGSADGTGTAASFNYPAGVALDASGNLYVADGGNNKIRKITFPGGGQPCLSDQTTLCLGGGRFKVTTQWATSGDRNGAGRALAPAGGDSGYFTFFDPGSVEVAVKVVNACGAGGSFWIFAAGLTDVGVVMTVTDTQTGKAKSYANAQGTPFRPIQDTSTFATCAAGATADAFGRSLDASLLHQRLRRPSTPAPSGRVWPTRRRCA